MLPSLKEIECINQLPGWRLHFAWLRLKEGEHQAALRIAIEGTVSIFREKFSHNSYFDEPIVRSVRSLLGKNDLGQKECLSSFELLAQKILAGDDIAIENPGIVFRNLLSLKSFAPWSIMDIGNVSFPFVFRTGKEGDTLKSKDRTFTLKGCPVLCDKAGKLSTPLSITDGEDITPSSRNILLVCYAPLERAREVAAKSHLGNLVHMTQVFRFVMERAFLPSEV